MNPYRYNPKLITSVDQARSVGKFFDNEIAVGASNVSQAEETLNAVFDVILKAYPDLAPSFDELVFAARLTGQVEQWRMDIERMRSEFIAALPYQIRLQL